MDPRNIRTETKRPAARSGEAREQEAVVTWCRLNHIPVVHIPNEGKRSAAVGAALKRAGLQKGFPDLFFPLPRGSFHGLFIEMKYGKNKTTPEQKECLAALTQNGYLCAVCYGCDDAIRTIRAYFKAKKEE